MKTRFALSAKGTYKSIMHCISVTVQADGVAGLYRGLSTSIIGVVPYAGLDLMVNSIIKETASSYYDQRKEEPGVFVLLGAGMVSSTVAMSVTYPLNLVRTRLQASGMPGNPVYSSPLNATKMIYSKEGIKGFFRVHIFLIDVVMFLNNRF